MDQERITQMNREAWNEAMPYHQRGRKINYETAWLDPKFLSISDKEQELFAQIGLAGKQVVHLCCNNGLELISLIRLGAQRGVGYDICDEAIKEATKFAQIANANCTFYQTDVFTISPPPQPDFDVVYLSVGCLSWLPDLPAFFHICAQFLKPGGNIIIFDIHPYVNMLGFPGEPNYIPAYPLNPRNSYFKADPFIDTDGIDYIGGTTYEGKPALCFSYKVSDLVNGLVQAGIQILEFHEYAEDYALVHQGIAPLRMLPLTFSLIGRK